MYNLPYHKEKDEQLISAFIAENPFAFLTGCDANNKPVATQVPMLIDTCGGKQILRGHLMKNTDHHRAFAHNEHVLAVFTGRHSYVSATWYANPNTASTWNYMSVHAQGTIRLVAESELEEILQMTSMHFEGQNRQSATVYENIPADFKEKTLRMIVGFEIEITHLDTVFKLSQDKDVESYQSIIEKLKDQDQDGRAIASEMEKRKHILYPKK